MRYTISSTWAGPTAGAVWAVSATGEPPSYRLGRASEGEDSTAPTEGTGWAETIGAASAVTADRSGTRA